jgi:hypothetical protein
MKTWQYETEEALRTDLCRLSTSIYTRASHGVQQEE